MFTINRIVPLSIRSVQQRAFHASIQVNASKAVRKLKSIEKKKKNIAIQSTMESKKEQVDPVLGKPNNPLIQRLELEVTEPNILIQGYNLHDVDRLLYGAKEAKIEKTIAAVGESEETINTIKDQESEKRDILLRILTLRNADNEEKQKKLTSLAVNEFARFEGDTGSSEVQAAVMTIEIYNLMNHIRSHPQDLLYIRKARMLTQKRQRILRYLKRDNPQKYFWAIEKLGLTDETVFMEFNFDRKYCDEFQVWPGRNLVKITKKDNEERKKEKRLEKQAFRRAMSENNQESKE